MNTHPFGNVQRGGFVVLILVHFVCSLDVGNHAIPPLKKNEGHDFAFVPNGEDLHDVKGTSLFRKWCGVV